MFLGRYCKRKKKKKIALSKNAFHDNYFSRIKTSCVQQHVKGHDLVDAFLTSLNNFESFK